MSSIRYTLNHEMPQFTRGKTNKTLDYLLDNSSSDNLYKKHPLHIIVTNRSLAETQQWKFRTKNKFNDFEQINIAILSSNKESKYKNVESLITNFVICDDISEFPNIIIMCCHPKRIQEDCIKILKMFKNTNFNIAPNGFDLKFIFDEADANITVIYNFLNSINNKFKNVISEIQFITATPFKSFWEMLAKNNIFTLGNIDFQGDNCEPYYNLLKKYQQFSQHNIIINNYDSINPLEYIQNCFNLNLIDKETRNIIFAPAHIYTNKTGFGSHNEIVDYFNKKNYAVLLHNGIYKGFIYPDNTTETIEQFNKKHNINGELRNSLRKWLTTNNYSLAITGNSTIERGITFNTDLFNFTHMILSKYHYHDNALNKLIQMMGRGSGNNKYVGKINVICTENIKYTIFKTIENLINIKNNNPEEYNLQHFNNKKTNNTIPVKVEFNDINILNEIINETDNKKRHKIILFAIEDEDITIYDHNDTNKFNIDNYILKTCRIFDGINKKNRRFRQFNKAFTRYQTNSHKLNNNEYSIDLCKKEYKDLDYVNPINIGWITYCV